MQVYESIRTLTTTCKEEVETYFKELYCKSRTLKKINRDQLGYPVMQPALQPLNYISSPFRNTRRSSKEIRENPISDNLTYLLIHPSTYCILKIHRLQSQKN
jgi:hypothetical protein